MARKRPFSSMLASLAHMGGQVLGVVLAILVSHLIARRLGAGDAADAFFFGRRIITSVIETLAQVMGVFYIPLLAADAVLGRGAFWRATLRHAGLAALAGLAFAGLVALTADAVVRLLAPDFPPEAAALAARILTVFGAALPATMACIVFAAFLNVAGRFGAPSTIRQLPRATIVLALALASGDIALRGAAAFTLGWALTVGILVLMCLAVLRDHDAEARPASRREKPTRAYGAAAVLLVLGALAATWLETAYAAGLGPGGVTLLELSQRLGALIANTLAGALSLVAFAGWSRRGAEGAPPAPTDFWRTVLMGLSALVPIQVFFVVNSDALVDLLLLHGEFTASDAAEVSRTLRWMTLAPLSAFVLRMALVRILAEPKAPVIALVGCGVVADVLLKAALFQVLTPRFGIVGIVLAQSIAPLVGLGLLLALTARLGIFLGPLRLGRSAGLIVAAGLAAVGMIAGARIGGFLAPLAAAQVAAVAPLTTPLALAASGLLGMALFLAALRLMRVPLSLD